MTEVNPTFFSLLSYFFLSYFEIFFKWSCIRVATKKYFPSSVTAVVPNLFWCITPLAHFGTFHSSPITQFHQGGWKGLNVIFAMTQVARCGLKYNPSGIIASFQ